MPVLVLETTLVLASQAANQPALLKSILPDNKGLFSMVTIFSDLFLTHLTIVPLWLTIAMLELCRGP